MSTTTDDPLAAARGAAAAQDWDRGLQLFKDADASGRLDPEDLEAMQDAATPPLR